MSNRLHAGERVQACGFKIFFGKSKKNLDRFFARGILKVWQLGCCNKGKTFLREK